MNEADCRELVGLARALWFEARYFLDNLVELIYCVWFFFSFLMGSFCKPLLHQLRKFLELLVLPFLGSVIPLAGIVRRIGSTSCRSPRRLASCVLPASFA